MHDRPLSRVPSMAQGKPAPDALPMQDSLLLEEAAGWVMTLCYEAPSPTQRQAFERWRGQSPAHEAAWERARGVLNIFEEVPAGIGRGALEALGVRQGRRQSLKLLGVLLMAAPSAWLAWRLVPERPADFSTATGERKSLDLPDGTRLVLNTASGADVAYSTGERRIRLRAGEILVITGHDPSAGYRPFLVDTPHGVIHALGTRFSVRLLDRDTTRVAVFEHAVEVHPTAGPPRTLHEGEQADFGAARISGPVPVEPSAALWEKGMLLAKDMPLGEVIGEMARHYAGELHCDPAVANLRVSGAISLADTDAGLSLLGRALPIRIERPSPRCVMIVPRT